MSESKVRFWFSYDNANTSKIFTVLIFLLGGLDVLDGALTVGNFVALNGYCAFAVQSVSFFMTLGRGYQNAAAAFSRIVEIFDAPFEVNGEKIMDEPDNNLDAGAVDALTEKIRAEKQRRITLIISHDERLIDIADEIIFFDKRL